MLQNKIYINFSLELLRTFFIILFGFTTIALTVRAVNFLDLIVESGYSISTYFLYSILNLFGIAPKFIPISFMLALITFILKHLQDGEFLILWTSGVEKKKIVNLFFVNSLIILSIYIIFSSAITPYTLNKSRQILTQNNFNSILPTVKSQEFSDSFKGLTFFVEKKINNEIQNIFLNDKGINLKNFSANKSKIEDTTIIAKKGIMEQKKIFLFNGQIISSHINKKENNVIKFDQIVIDLSDLATTTIKKPKLQETASPKLLKCLSKNYLKKDLFCQNTINEIPPTLNRRFTLPLYIPVISLVCCLLLIKNQQFYFNKIFVYSYCFTILLFTELALRYTGINYFIKYLFILLPFILLVFLYILLNYKFSKEAQSL